MLTESVYTAEHSNLLNLISVIGSGSRAPINYFDLSDWSGIVLSTRSSVNLA